MIGDSPMFIDPDDNVTIKGSVFRERRGCENYWRVRM